MTANAWTFFVFDTPFEYDGNSNLVIVADDNTGSYDNSPYMACSVFNTSSSQAIFYWDDNTNFNPLSPPTSAGSSNANGVLSVKNHIIMGIESHQMAVSIELGEGWNWWAPNVEITLADLEAALGTNGLKIESQNQFVSYNPNTGTWSGNLQELVIGQMYKIKTSQTCTLSFTGNVVNPDDHPISLSHGNNWIGFIGTNNMTIEEALGNNFTPSDRDVIKSPTAKATYYQGYGWQGKLTELEPGKGYVYKSNARGTSKFTFPGK